MQVWGLKTLQNDFLVFFGFYFIFHLVSPSNILEKPNFKVAVISRLIMNIAQTLQVTVHQLAFYHIIDASLQKHILEHETSKNLKNTHFFEI